MKKTLFTALRAMCVGAMTLFAVSCYDDSALNSKVEELDKRLTEVEQKLNDDVAALTSLVSRVDSLAAKVAAVKVETSKDGVTTLTLSDGTELTVSANGVITIVEEDGVQYWGVVEEDGTVKNLGVEVGHKELVFTVDAETSELLLNGAGTGVFVPTDAAYILGDIKEGDATVTLTIGDAEFEFMLADDSASLVLGRADFFLRYEGSKTIELLAEGVSEYYVMNEPDGWKTTLEGTALTVTAPTSKAIEIGAAQAEGLILVHGTTAEGKCKVAKVEVKAGPGLTLAVDIDGNVTVENSYYGESNTEYGETSFGFSDFIFGLATPSLFHEDPQAYVQYYNDNWEAPNWDILFPSAYNFAEKGMYVEGEYETDIVKTTVADAYFMMMDYQDLPDGAYYVVWVAPVTGEGKAVIEDMVYTDYVNIKWNVAVKETTHSDITLTAEVAGASKFIINAVAESTYNPEWNPMSFDEYMNAPMGGPWNGFKSYGAANALGLVVNVEDVPAEFKLSDILEQKLAFGENYKIWVMPVFDHLAIYDEANSMPEYDLYVYDFSAFDYEDHFLPFVLDAKTNELEAGGEYAATLELNRSEFTAIYVDVEVAEGTESVYYNWYTPEEYAEFESDAAVMEALFMDCYSPLTENGQVNKSYINPGDEYVLATVSIGTDGKYGEIVTGNFSALEIPYDENITVELVSAELDAEGTNYTVTVKVTGATKVMGYNLTHSDYYYGQFPLNVCKNGHKASYAGYQMADVVDGQAVLTFAKSNYKKDYYVAAYNVTDGVVSAISAECVVEHLFD